jgi:hypothetical protein
MLLTLLGAGFGICASFIAWYIAQRVIVPKVEFLPEISKNKSDYFSNGYSYRFKFYNRGKRDIIDMSVFAEVCIKQAPGAQTNKTIEIARPPLDANSIPLLAKGGNRIVALILNNVERFNKPVYGSSINEKHKTGELTLEDLLSVGAYSYIRVYAFGYDRWSGARKVFVSKNYTIDDIKTGRWDLKTCE